MSISTVALAAGVCVLAAGLGVLAAGLGVLAAGLCEFRAARLAAGLGDASADDLGAGLVDAPAEVRAIGVADARAEALTLGRAVGLGCGLGVWVAAGGRALPVRHITVTVIRLTGPTTAGTKSRRIPPN
jgi:hypothetical protein